MFSKEHYFYFLLSLKRSERFLLSLPPGPGINYGNDKFLSSKCEILEPVSYK